MNNVTKNALLDHLESMQKDVQVVGDCRWFHKSLMQHRHLMFDLATLTDAVRQGTISNHNLLGCLALSETDVNGLGTHISSCLPSEYWNLRRPEDSKIASTVFGIPEALENILSSCKTFDILSIYKTCRGIRDIIDASPKLQTLLCLRPAPQGTPRYFPFDNDRLPGFECPYDTCHEDASKIVAEISVSMDPDGFYWPHIGSRLRDMYICQPSLHYLLASDHCPQEDDDDDDDDDDDCHGSDPGIQMFSERGFTVGDLYDVAKRLADEHTICRSTRNYAFYDVEEDDVATLEIRFTECQTQEDWDEATLRTARTYKRWDEQDRALEEKRLAAALYEGYGSGDALANDGGYKEQQPDQDGSRCASEHADGEGDLRDHEDSEAASQLDDKDEGTKDETKLADALYDGYGDA